MPEILELGGKVLSFAGGALLTFDMLRVRQGIEAESGGKALLKAGAGKALRARDGTAVQNEAALRLLLSRSSTTRAWIGFLLMTCGFLLEIIGLLIARP